MSLSCQVGGMKVEHLQDFNRPGLTVEQIRRVFCDNFVYFSIKTCDVGTR